jgi:hypothetical protein
MRVDEAGGPVSRHWRAGGKFSPVDWISIAEKQLSTISKSSLSSIFSLFCLESWAATFREL